MRKVEIDRRLLEVYREIGANVILLRGRSMSQDQLAAKAGISRATVSTIENGGSISLENLIRIAGALGVKPADLFITEEDRQRVSYMHVKVMERIADSLGIKKGDHKE